MRIIIHGPRKQVAAITPGRLVIEVTSVSEPYENRKGNPRLYRVYLEGDVVPVPSTGSADPGDGSSTTVRRSDQPGHGGVSPLAEIEDRKAARDLGGELAAITGHWKAMESQSWWPPRAGDVAIGHPDGDDTGAYGATFLAEHNQWGEVCFREISSTIPGSLTDQGVYDIHDLWFEWPAISMVRAGRVYAPERGGR